MTAMTKKDYEGVVDAVKQFESPWLRDLQAIIVAQLKSREKEDIQKARLEIQRIAQSLGMTPIQLLNVPKTRTASGFFQNPNDPTLQWSGMGRKPTWIVEWLAAGKSIDDLRG
jgi:DNA-binding protein H-NS